jgi:hypothetical protein
VLATVHREAEKWTPEEAEAFMAPLRQKFEAATRKTGNYFSDANDEAFGPQ